MIFFNFLVISFCYIGILFAIVILILSLIESIISFKNFIKNNKDK